MAQTNRPTAQTGLFAEDGDRYSWDPADPQSMSRFDLSVGFVDGKKVDRRFVNTLLHRLEQAAGHLLDWGIAPWSADASYYPGSIVTDNCDGGVWMVYRARAGQTQTVGTHPADEPATWERIAFSEDQMPANPIFGTGRDGVGNNPVSEALFLPRQYSALTIGDGFTYTPHAPIQVSGLLNIVGTGLFSADAPAADSTSTDYDDGSVSPFLLRWGTRGGVPGASAPPRALPGSFEHFRYRGPGDVDVVLPVSSVACGGNGGYGGVGSVDLTGQQGGSIPGLGFNPYQAPGGFLLAPGFYAGPMPTTDSPPFYRVERWPFAGGMGGGASSAMFDEGAKGGWGGGVIWIACRHLNIAASGLHFVARGSAGQDVQAAGFGSGGGGGGGVIVILYETATFPTITGTTPLKAADFTWDGKGISILKTCSAAGGAAGGGTAPGAQSGAPGSAGYVIAVQVAGCT